jgi:hypothetical protein
MRSHRAMRATGAVSIAICSFIAICVAAAPNARGDDGDTCDYSTGEFTGPKAGGSGVIVNGTCKPTSAPGGATGPPVETKQVNCGLAALSPTPLGWNDACGTPIPCYVTVLGVETKVPAATYATFQRSGPNAPWVLVDKYCPGAPDLQPSPEALREQAIRLLPAVPVGGSAVPNTLVQFETITWADTAAQRTLGPVSVVGRQVWIRIQFEHANWDYGDGEHEQRATPGLPYPSAGVCRTRVCSRYDGHVYTAGGNVTVRLAVTWTASFSLDGTTFASITGDPITGPTTTLNYIVHTAHSVLVAR